MVRMARAGGRGAALVAGLVGLATPLAAHQPAQTGPLAEGWIGVNLTQRFECLWETNEDWKSCSLVMHVRELEEDGPAATGGLQVGDRLLAIDNEEITYGNWERVLGGIRPQVPVSIDVMRGGERHFAHVIPARRPSDLGAVAWVGDPSPAAEPAPEQRAFVFTLTEPRGRESIAFAITVRDVEDGLVDVAPAAVRVRNGQLHLTPLDDDVFGEFPELRNELLGDLTTVTESTYRRATSALDVFERIGQRLAYPEFQRRLARIARVGLEQPELALRFGRSFGGAEFEPIRKEGRPGLLVLRVVPRTAAARVGLRSGDLVVLAGERATRQVSDLIEAVRQGGEGSVQIVWLRDGRRMSEVWPGR